MKQFVIVGTGTFGLEFIVIVILTFLPRLALFRKDAMEAYTKAPWLDLLLSVMIWIPWLVGGWRGGILGIIAAVIAQIVAMQLWIVLHEFVHRQSIRDSPRIDSFLNQKVGWWRNHIIVS